MSLPADLCVNWLTDSRNNLMKTRLIRSLTALAVGAACSAALQAEEVIIEARVALLNGDPAYAEFDGNWQNSSVHTTAPGVTAGVGSRFNTTAGSSVVLMPTLEAGGTYLVFAAFPAPSSQTADMVAQVDIVGGTLTELSEGTTAPTTNSPNSGTPNRAQPSPPQIPPIPTRNKKPGTRNLPPPAPSSPSTKPSPRAFPSMPNNSASA